MHTSHPVNFRLVRLGIAAATLAAALVGALAVGAVQGAGAVKAKQLGKTRHKAKPSCPKTPCEAIGSVTGFQTQVRGEKGLFKVPRDGRIFAYRVDTSRPTKEQREFFADFYGGDPTVRLAILRNRRKVKFELVKQSPRVTLKRDLGTSPVVTLNKPLGVRKGDVVGLTIPTWLPAFAVGQSRRDVWRASRAPDKCTGRKAIKSGRPQQKVGSVRHYGCRYTTARLLYWAYFVPDRGTKERRR